MNDEITIAAGSDRLTLQYDEGHFRALVWSSERGGEWHCRVVITQADFECDCDRERWPNALHSFDPATGCAIIKVGEMEVPRDKAGPGGFRRVVYSWREWDLLANRELRVLRVCEDPFEEYGTPRKVYKAIVHADQDSVVIDCNFEGWDGCLYNALGSGKCIELRNLHSSYGPFMKQLEDIFCMQFTAEVADNRGKFRPRT